MSNQRGREGRLKRIIKKILVASCISLVTVSLVVIGAKAWTLHNVDVENILTSRTVDVVIEEAFPSNEILVGDVTKEVSFTNTGSAAVFVRFTYAEYWETEIELLEGETEEDYVTLNWSTDQENESNLMSWYAGDDGWYYYLFILGAGETISILDSVTFSDRIPEGADYSLIFQVETVQVSDEEDVNVAATEALFGITGTTDSVILEYGAVLEGTVTWTPIEEKGDGV